MYYLGSDRHLPTCWSSPLEMMLMAYEKAATTYGRAHVTPLTMANCSNMGLLLELLDFSRSLLRHFSLPAIGL